MSLLTVEVIAHKDQRYCTPGDWKLYPSGDIAVFVSDLGNWKFHALMGVHELVEALVCRELGVTQEAVDAFDAAFLRGQESGLYGKDAEPGYHPEAPYRLAHFVAETVERVLAVALNADWAEYGRRVGSL